MALFSDTSFFILLAVLGIPAFILGYKEKPIHPYGFAVSLFFVWLSMGSNARALIYLMCFLMLEYGAAVLYLKLRKEKGRVAGTYYIFLLLSLLPLIFNKISTATGSALHVFGFLGISYMTFKAAQVIIQTYDGQIKAVDPFGYIYMMVFFPVITSGPIDRSMRFENDLSTPLTRKAYTDQAGEGLWKMMLGLLYKQVFAVIFYQMMESWCKGKGFWITVLYMYLYGFYLFFDFAGYSLMAVGASYLFGIRTPDNFKKPFVSHDMKEFWDRWHITLSHWFRDFIFSRVTMDLMKTRKIKNRLTIAGIAFFIDMGVMGIWHGTELHYIIYGLYHAFWLTATEVYQKKSKFYKKHKKERWFMALEWLVTFQLVMFGFLIFSGRLF